MHMVEAHHPKKGMHDVGAWSTKPTTQRLDIPKDIGVGPAIHDVVASPQHVEARNDFFFVVGGLAPPHPRGACAQAITLA